MDEETMRKVARGGAQILIPLIKSMGDAELAMMHSFISCEVVMRFGVKAVEHTVTSIKKNLRAKELMDSVAPE